MLSVMVLLFEVIFHYRGPEQQGENQHRSAVGAQLQGGVLAEVERCHEGYSCEAVQEAPALLPNRVQHRSSL